MNKIEIHKQICDKLHDTYKAKNADYGDSFARVRKEEGDTAILVRTKDKLYRLETLLHGAERNVADESVDDTLLDLANYCIMELLERQAERPRKYADMGTVIANIKPCEHCKHWIEAIECCEIGSVCNTSISELGVMREPSHWEPKEGAINE